MLAIFEKLRYNVRVLWKRSLSSVGRAPALQAGGHWFEPSSDHHLRNIWFSYMFKAPCGGVAQLVRALACHARGRGFEPRHSRHTSPDSSVGRARDWKSLCPWFDSASGHHVETLIMATGSRGLGRGLQNLVHRFDSGRRLHFLTG